MTMDVERKSELEERAVRFAPTLLCAREKYAFLLSSSGYEWEGKRRTTLLYMT